MRLVRLALVCGTFLGSAATTLWLGWPQAAPETARAAAGSPTPQPAVSSRAEGAPPLPATVEEALASSNALLRAERLLPLLGQLSESELVRVIDRLGALHAARPGWMANVGAEALQVALVELTRKSAARALESAVGLPGSSLARGEALGDVSRAIPLQLRPSLTRDLSAEHRKILEQAEFGENAEADIAWMLRHWEGREPWLRFWLEGAFEDLARDIGGPAALQRADALANPAQRKPARVGAALGWAQRDPLAALTWIERQEEREDMQPRAFAQAVETQPAAVAAFVATLPKKDRRDLLVDLAHRWANADPRSAFAWVRGLGPDEATATRGIIHLWVQLDPAGAMAAALRLDAADGSKHVLAGEAMKAWAAEDPAAARDWLRALPAGSLRSATLAAFTTAVLDTIDDPSSALDFYGSMPLTASDDAGVRAAVQRLAEVDFPAARTWVMALGQRDRAAPLVAALAERQVKTDVVGATALLTEWFGRGAESRHPVDKQLVSAAATVLGRRAADDPLAAANVLLQLPSEARQESLAIRVAEVWAARDPAAAVAWFATSGVVGAPIAVGAILRNRTRQDPQSALALVVGLKGEVRAAALYAIRFEWLRIDPPAARAWAKREGLEEVSK